MNEADQWHRRDAGDAARAQGVDPALGLGEADLARRALEYGANELTRQPRRSPVRLLLEQFTDFMVLVLLGAALISGLIGDLVDTLTILFIVAVNALIGFTQAWRADKAMAALQRLAAAQATVVRNGEVCRVASSQLVPGDIVLIEAGNQVPADLRLLEVAQFRVDESSLTGESVTVEKTIAALQGETHALGDRVNMAYKGTTATHGRARGLVVATGMRTELGKVAGLLDRDTDRSTPLQRRLAAFGKRLSVVVLGICLVIFAVGLLRGEAPLLMALTAISLAVAAIPEALPAVVTVLLALGARRMVSFNALIRRLPSVETLGSVTFIASDKTGTLTQNRMQAQWLMADGRRCPPGAPPASGLFHELLRAAALCNDAIRSPSGAWQGDPTETALAEVAAESGLGRPSLDAVAARVFEFPFDADRKRMTTVHRDPDGLLGYTKGAPETVVPRCATQWTTGGPVPLRHQAALDAAETMAREGLRVLAFARRRHENLPAAHDREAAESDLSLIGFIGLIDPPRPEALAAVRDCITAGITPVMITGDHPATARAIARSLGILPDEADSVVVTGAELANLDDTALRERVRAVRVYARVDPLQKIRIVQALQAHGEYVAMTGDGVNDAPALKQADIGVAMGRGGTDVAREASSLVLLDDNFATIVAAVREGRRIYDNIRKFVRYAMTGNSAELWTLFLAPMIGLPIPLLPIHILWINLVTDGLPGLALAAEPAERGVMRRAPRPPGESLFAHGLWQHVLVIGLLLAGLCLGVQAWALDQGNPRGQTMVFTVLTLGQMAHVLAIRSEAEPLWRIGLASNRPLLGAVFLTIVLQLATIYVPALNPVFHTEPLTGRELLVCLAAAALVWVAAEAEKAWRVRRRAVVDAQPDAIA